MKIGIGIDTGGTYTDAVAYDFDTDTVLAKGKALTTREDLSIGISNALDLLPPEMISDAKLISLSTTLATNACVEDKGCRAKLLVFGLTDELIVQYGADKKYGFKRENVRCFDTNSSADGFVIDQPDWDYVASEIKQWVSDADAMSVSELFSASNGAPCEKQAKTILEDQYELPTVIASELSSDLDVLARGATAMLNARLFPIGQEFVEAALKDFEKRGTDAPITIVRSDGSLMTAEFTKERPVETILSGPAASVLAGKSFAGEKDFMIIDMGGTTTDVSVVRQGKPTIAGSGIQIGGWKTHVKGVFIDTFALGGDSTVRVVDGKARLFPRRAMPICVAATRWPEIKSALQSLLYDRHTNLFPLHEAFYLVREPDNISRYNMYEQNLIELLRKGPRLLGKFTKEEGIDLYHLNSERLEAEGVVMRCGLTPTDFMHIKGDFDAYDGEASEIAARFMLLCLKRTNNDDNLNALADEVYSMVEESLYTNLLRILLAHEYPKQFADGVDAQAERLISESWEKRNSDDVGFFRNLFETKAALVGVGAPTHIFLPNVAKYMGTDCILPEHAAVANALGALRADYNTIVQVDIIQMLSLSEGVYYVVHAPEGSQKHFNYQSAIRAAEVAAEAAAVKEARNRGALGELIINTYVKRHVSENQQGMTVATGCTIISEVSSSSLA
ncbi:MAG: hydantoinase/oxoprolinase family protein [Oscillospiraceae bacterium]|nr:hydantoinase/oxoprolinase family protein [Oscillospiraceae bacterium]